MDNDSSPKAVLGDHNDFPAGTKTEEQFAFVIERLRMKRGTFWYQDHQKGPRIKKIRAKSKTLPDQTECSILRTTQKRSLLLQAQWESDVVHHR